MSSIFGCLEHKKSSSGYDVVCLARGRFDIASGAVGFKFSGNTGYVIDAAPAITAAGLKIHTHANVNNSGGTYDNTYMNELKGEFVSTSGTMVGIGADYTLSGTGTGAMCASSGYAKLLATKTLSGSAYPAVGCLTGGQFVADVFGTLSGTAVLVTGLYGGIGASTGSTWTTAKYVSAIWGDYKSVVTLGTGDSHICLLTNSNTSTVDYGLRIVNESSGAITTGISVVAAMTTGIYVNSSATGADGRIAQFYGTCAAGNMGDGYGSVEIDLTCTGTLGGTVAATSTWVNMGSGSVGGGNRVCVRSDGIYVPASGTPMSSATAIIGGRLSYIAEGGGNPGKLYLFETNISDNQLTSIFACNAAVDYRWTTGAKSGTAGNIPLFKDESAGVTWYVNVYSS